MGGRSSTIALGGCCALMVMATSCVDRAMKTSGSDGGADAWISPTLGRMCDLGDARNGRDVVLTLNALALDCASRLCLAVGGAFSPVVPDEGQTGALCTELCETDGDCAGGESAVSDAPDDHRCRTGFACVILFSAGDFCCRKMCLCRDFLDPKSAYPMPAACWPDAGSNCRNN